ncbi:hypothetical protein ZWY2020_016924 [Hordeum vulgare]|nr:hypothetical protein ZWY2020_016924 [Hordeum vulgare]
MLREEQEEEEEFHEADILWPDAAQEPDLAQTRYSHDDGDGDGDDDGYSGEYRRPTKAPNWQLPPSTSRGRPVGLPAQSLRLHRPDSASSARASPAA